MTIRSKCQSIVKPAGVRNQRMSFLPKTDSKTKLSFEGFSELLNLHRVAF